MNDNVRRSRELQQLVVELTEGPLTDEQLNRLEELLTGDARTRAEFHQQLWMHATLLFGQHPPPAMTAPPATAEEFAEYVRLATNQSMGAKDLQEQTGITADRADVGEGRFRSAMIEREQVVSLLPPRHWTRILSRGGALLSPASMLAILATTFLVGAAVAMVAMISVPKLLARQTEVPLNVVQLPPDYVVARLVRGVEAHWEPSASAVADGAFLTAGQTLELKAGIAEVVFVKGARVILEGPATLRLETEDQAALRSGRLTARVPSQAVGFSVKTPTVLVVDLGTEFGLQVTSDGSSEVFVYEGQVLAQLLDNQGRPVAGDSSTMRIHEGGAAQFHAALVALNSDRVDRNGFVRDMPPAAGELRSADYAKEVLADDPLAYWRFDEGLVDMANQTVEDSARSGAVNDDGVLGANSKGADKAPNRIHSPLGGAVQFNGSSDFVEIPDSADLTAAKRAITIEYWIKPGKLIGKTQDLLSKRNAANNRGFNFESDMHNGVVHHHLAINGWIEGGPYVAFTYRPGRWQHVAIVWQSGEKLLAYLDGRLVAQSHLASTGVIEYDDTPLNVGRNSMYLPHNPNYFQGAIDELAIYDRALPAERIHAHYKAAYSGQTM